MKKNQDLVWKNFSAFYGNFEKDPLSLEKNPAKLLEKKQAIFHIF